MRSRSGAWGQVDRFHAEQGCVYGPARHTKSTSLFGDDARRVCVRLIPAISRYTFVHAMPGFRRVVEPADADLREPTVEKDTGIPTFAAGRSGPTFPRGYQRSDKWTKGVRYECYSGSGEKPTEFAEPFPCAAAGEMASRGFRVYGRDSPSLEFIKHKCPIPWSQK